MAAPEGNQYAANARRWRTAIDKALEMKSKASGQEKLVEIACQLIDKAAEGDLAALKELGDRIDGKPGQTIGFDPNAPLNVQHKGRIKIVRPNS